MLLQVTSAHSSCGPPSLAQLHGAKPLPELVSIDCISASPPQPVLRSCPAHSSCPTVIRKAKVESKSLGHVPRLHSRSMAAGAAGQIVAVSTIVHAHRPCRHPSCCSLPDLGQAEAGKERDRRRLGEERAPFEKSLFPRPVGKIAWLFKTTFPYACFDPQSILIASLYEGKIVV